MCALWRYSLSWRSSPARISPPSASATWKSRLPTSRELDPAERYDVIAVTASLPIYDARFQEQLEVGGRLFVVVGEAPVMDARRVVRESEDRWIQESLFETVVDPLIHARRPEEFVF